MMKIQNWFVIMGFCVSNELSILINPFTHVYWYEDPARKALDRRPETNS